jgi:hypothetical protein
MNSFGMTDDIDSAYQMMCEGMEVGEVSTPNEPVEQELTQPEPEPSGPLYASDSQTSSDLAENHDYDITKAQSTQRTNTSKTYVSLVSELESRGLVQKMDADEGVGSKILDFSAGKGAGSQVLKGNGYYVETYEPYYNQMGGVMDFDPDYTNASELGSDEYDLVILNCVVNVLPVDLRDGVIQDAYRTLKPGGLLYVSAMGQGDHNNRVKNCRVHVSDTETITGVGTYQKMFTNQSLAEYVNGVGGVSFEIVKPSVKVGISKVLLRKL